MTECMPKAPPMVGKRVNELRTLLRAAHLVPAAAATSLRSQGSGFRDSLRRSLPEQARAGHLRNALRAGWRHHPGVHARFVNGNGRRRKPRVRERAHGNADAVRQAQRLVVERRTSARTEVGSGARTLVAGLFIAGRPPRHRHLRSENMRLLAEGATGPKLAGHS